MAGGAVAPHPIMTSPARLALRVLGDDDVVRLHAAALELLGAEAAAAEAAAVSAPSSFVLAGRVPEHDLTVGDGRVWLAAGVATAGPGGVPARVRPLVGGDPVQATAADLDVACRLADALPEVAVVAGPPVRAVGETPLGELARCFAGTSKHVLCGTLTTAGQAEAALAMAAAVAGSEAERRRRPPLSLCAVADGLDAALVFAHAGLPVALIVPPAVAARAPSVPATAGTPVSAAGAPSGLAAALVRHHAGALAGCAAVQAAAPGARFLYPADPAAFGLPAAGPVAALFQLGAAQLAAHVGLPLVAAGMRTASHEPDWQASTQDAFASFCTTAAGVAVTAGAGTLSAGTAFSPQQLAMDAEVFSWNARISLGIDVQDESIALDTIKQVGIGGNYLGQRHTRRHMKDVWRPRLLDRSMWDAWIASGKEGAYEKATGIVDGLLAGHEVVPLGDEVSGMLERIAAEAGL